VLDNIGEYLANLLEGGFLWCHTREVYHGGRLRHECADGLDIAELENRKGSARILEATIMRIGRMGGSRILTGEDGRGLSDAWRWDV
jgi:hypothetical protein